MKLNIYDEVKYLFLINKNNKLIYKTIFFDNFIVINNREKNHRSIIHSFTIHNS
jgi:hypothetical protein